MAKSRKMWTTDSKWGTIVCSNGFSRTIKSITEQGRKFLFWYGLKQFLSDAVAGIADIKGQVAGMEKKFSILENPEAKLERTEAGTFRLVDPSRKIVRMTNEARLEAARKSAIQAMVEKGIDPEMAEAISQEITLV